MRLARSGVLLQSALANFRPIDVPGAIDRDAFSRTRARRVHGRVVLAARDFPTFQKTHCRISYGPMDEMKTAVTVFEQVLAQKATAA